MRIILENRDKGFVWLTHKTGLSRQQVMAVAYQDRYIPLIDRALADIKKEREAE